MKLKKWQMIELLWVDLTHTTGWKNSKEYEGEPLINHRTIGYLLQDTKKTITLVMSLSENVTEIMDIPKVSISKIRIIK